jgi:uncharacterized membrane protein
MWKHLEKYFLSGLIVFLPLSLTIFLLVSAVNFFDKLLGRYLEPIFMDQFGIYFRGFGILIGLYLILLTGVLVTNFLGRKIYDFFEGLLIKLPFFRQVYPALKEMAIFFFSRDRITQFRQVVLVEYPRKGIYSFGFLTNDTSPRLALLTKTEMCNVFVPSAPSPVTGFAVMVPKKDVIYTDISVEETFKFMLSGGVVNPP